MITPRPIEVRTLPGYTVWLRFSDGASGEVDLSDLAGKGVFAAWLEPGFFERAYISDAAGTLSWPGELDLDPVVLYCEVTGKKVVGDSEAA
jgi:hypothetical protein